MTDDKSETLSTQRSLSIADVKQKAANILQAKRKLQDEQALADRMDRIGASDTGSDAVTGGAPLEAELEVDVDVPEPVSKLQLLCLLFLPLSLSLVYLHLVICHCNNATYRGVSVAHSSLLFFVHQTLAL